ncbi:MAG: hypothetical protein QUS09_09600 [Methanotrichaceae archaeon]|nr:hypothetical protein [Methanotrichaceae archaeon]
MTWQLFRLIYELCSPLHIGYHKVGNVQRTRYYVPARNLWGAVTERLARSGFIAQNATEGDYREIGKWVQEHCAFSYFFLSKENHLFTPRFTEKGLQYGELTAAEFERRYLGAHVTTALDSATTSVSQGSLHEVEFVSHHPLKGEAFASLCLQGWVFLDETASRFLGTEDKWKKWLGTLQIGGERRYGFGRIRLVEMKSDGQLCELEVQCDGDRPQVRLNTDQALLAHALVDGIRARGLIEPLVGRQTQHSQHFGMGLTQGRICWVPGSILEADTPIQLNQEGYWKFISGD